MVLWEFKVFFSELLLFHEFPSSNDERILQGTINLILIEYDYVVKLLSSLKIDEHVSDIHKGLPIG